MGPETTLIEGNNMSDEHEPFIKTPKQLITVIVLSFIIPIALIILLVIYVGGTKRDGAGSNSLTGESIAQRIAPVAKLELVDASAPKELASGEAVYTAQCSVCHAAGVAGAPKFADADLWAARISTGYDALLASVVKGKGVMAAQSGGQYSDLELGRAIVHMVNAAGGDMAEPSAEATASTDAAPAAVMAEASAAPVAEQVAQATESVTDAAKTVATAAGDAAKEMADKASAAADSAAGKAGAAVTATVAAGAAAISGAADKVSDAVKPVADKAAPAPVATATPASYDLEEGKKLYGTICLACHVSGAAGAPKFGDKAAWAGREEKGVEALTVTVITGKGGMPARGGSGGTDEQIAAAVAYMLSELK